MGRNKAQVFTQLEILLESHDVKDVLKLLADYMSTDELEKFLEHIQEEFE